MKQSRPRRGKQGIHNMKMAAGKLWKSRSYGLKEGDVLRREPSDENEEIRCEKAD